MKQWIAIIGLLIVINSHALILRVGVASNNPPYGIEVGPNYFTGFDMTLISTICSRLQAHCHYVAMPFKDYFMALDRGDVDLVIATITISKEREQSYLFSLPYLASRAEILTNITSRFNAIQDMEGALIGVHVGNITSELLYQQYHKHFTVKQYDNTGDLMLALNNNAVDAVLLESGAAQYWYANNASQYKLIPPSICIGEGYGIVAKKGQDALIGEINAALLQMQNDGTYLKIYSLYPYLTTGVCNNN